MPNDRNAFKAGLFIIISIVLIIAVVVAIKGVGRIIEPDQVRTATFKLTDDIGGLRIGDDVRVGGLKVGIVRSINVEQNPRDSAGEALVLVTFHMPERLVLRDGARIGVQGTLTGSSWLNFDSLGTGKPLADDATLAGRPGTFTVLTNTLNEVGPELKAIAQNIRTETLPKLNQTAGNAAELTAALRSRLDNIVERYNTVTARLTEALTQLRDLLGDTKTDLRTTIANVRSATGTIKEKLPPVMEKMDGVLAKVDKSIDSAQVALEDVKKTVANARDVSASARSIVVGNRGKIDAMISAIKTTGDNLKNATAEVRRSPWRLLYKPRPGEIENLNLYDSTRQFAEGANDLNGAAMALRDALKDPGVDQATVQKLVDRLDQSFTGFKQVEDELWKQVKE